MQTEQNMTTEEINKNVDEHIEEINREFRKGLEFLKKYPKSVTVFGSSRIKSGSPYYEKAIQLADKIVKETGYSVMTGGGPGIMEAINAGAKEAKGDSIGLNIVLPHEQKINPYTTDSVLFKYFFIRKAIMNFSAEAYVFFPGGFGTFDELFGILTLIQTKKIPTVPIILFGKDFWSPVKDLIEKQMLNTFNTIEPDNMNLFFVTDSPEDTIKIIKGAPVSSWWKMID
jgi:uncharacterized protein (TIGR00730 family)